LRAVCFNVRWGSQDGKTIDEIQAELLQKSPGGKWFFDQSFSDTGAAKAWHIPLDRWEKISPEHRGQMIEHYYTERTMRNWETWINRPKKK
jgi:hypothetical protein